MHTLSSTRRSIKAMREVSSRHDTGSRKAEGQKNQRAEYTHIPILPSECGYTRECADGIEGICFDELMADADYLLMCAPGEGGQVVIMKTPSFYCQGPCVSHPRKQNGRESFGLWIEKMRHKPYDYGIGTAHCWMHGYLYLMFIWRGKMIRRAGLENREQKGQSGQFRASGRSSGGRSRSLSYSLPRGPVTKTTFFLQRTSCLLPCMDMHQIEPINPLIHINMIPTI